MALKTIQIKIKSWKDGLNEVGQVMKDIQAGKKVKPKKPEVYFDSLDAVRSVLTDKRLELLRLVRDNHPKSVKDLARIAKRDFKLVYDDVERLKELGLITTSRAKRGVPTELKTDTDQIQVLIAV